MSQSTGKARRPMQRCTSAYWLSSSPTKCFLAYLWQHTTNHSINFLTLVQSSFLMLKLLSLANSNSHIHRQHRQYHSKMYFQLFHHTSTLWINWTTYGHYYNAHTNNNNNNNNVTCIAQMRQGRKCATTCQCQTGMFSVDFWMWPDISQLTAGRVAESSTWRDHERRNYGRRNLSSCVEWWAGECRQIAGDDDQHRMTSTCSTLWDIIRRRQTVEILVHGDCYLERDPMSNR